jgi:FRG domain
MQSKGTKSMLPTAAVCSIRDFFENLWDIPPQPDTHITLHRGQLNDLPLLPKLFRNPNTPDKVKAVEQKMLDTLKQIAAHVRPSNPANDWDWLSLGQHHGLTTRMSDWSTSPLIALFFAVELDPSDGAQPLVYQYPIMEKYVETVKTDSPGMLPRGEIGLIFAGMGSMLVLAGKPVVSAR